MESNKIMWAVVNRNHPAGCDPYIIESSTAYLRKDAIEKFTAGSGKEWRYWYRKYNFRCEKINVSLSTIKP